MYSSRAYDNHPLSGRCAAAGDSGQWPEGFFELNLSSDDHALLDQASAELEAAIARNRANRGAPYEAAMAAFLKSRQPGEIAVAPPVVAEIEYGIQRLEAGSRKRALLSNRQARLLSTIRVLDWTPQASVRYGGIKAALERSGQRIDDFDIAVAAIALAHDAQVITANLPNFTRIEGLRSRHWT